MKESKSMLHMLVCFSIPGIPGSATYVVLYRYWRRRLEASMSTSTKGIRKCCKSQNQLHQFPRSEASPQNKRQVRNKSVKSWRGQKSVVSCRFPNSITKTCFQQDGNFHVYGEIAGKRI